MNRELRRIIDEPTEGPWGIRVERVEIKDVSLPEGMKRSMSRQAEAERERRARIITADGEYQASKRLAAAANVMARDPAALQLRLLQTVVEVAAERTARWSCRFRSSCSGSSTSSLPRRLEAGRGRAADSASMADRRAEDVAQAEAEIESGAPAEIAGGRRADAGDLPGGRHEPGRGGHPDAAPEATTVSADGHAADARAGG